MTKDEIKSRVSMALKDPTHPQEYTDMWIELCEKAEQFLNEARAMEGQND